MKIKILVLLLLLSGICSGQIVNPIFTTPDTVCVNTPVAITNNTVGASNYFWNFCVAGINSTPASLNLGNPGGLLSEPVFSDIIEDNGSYYAFVVNHLPGGLVRLDFGNSLLNTPVPVFLGNPSGAMNATNGGNEGIQVIKNEGKWYAIIVGGNPIYGPSWPRIVKIEFGINIANNAPTGTNWGNLGLLNEPIDLHMFQDNGVWYGLTVNALSNTITKFNFTNSFNNIPTAVNLGNIGGLNYPTGVFAINDNGNWRVFVCNGNIPSSLTRLDFGNSLLNIPAGTNLGNPGNVLNSPRDFTLLRLCGEISGYAVNGTSNDLVQFNFHNDLLSVPSGISLGNTGNLNFPHSLSKLFRVGNDLYTLITNVNNNTITRLQFAGCTASSISSSALQNPPSIIYNLPGTYNINLSVDEGLPSQNSFCKQVVVLPELVHTPLQQKAACGGNPIKIGTGVKQASYLWSNGATTDSITISTPGTYWVQTSRFGCSDIDSFTVAIENLYVKANNDTTICAGKPVQLNAAGPGISYSWSPATNLSDPSIANPIGNPVSNTQYIVTTASATGCTAKDTVNITIADQSACNIVTIAPVFTAPDTVCVYAPVNIKNMTTGASSYYWSFCVAGINTVPTAVNLGNPGGMLSQPVFSDIVTDNGNYYAFVVDFLNGGITRLDFGNSMLNTPVPTDLGNPGGALNAMYGKEGIQVIKNEGKWYAIIVGGNPINGSTPKIVKIEFGANIANNSPTGTDWGNLNGNLLEPIDLYMFNESGLWYGFTTNANNNTITRFSFTNSFNNTPTAINLGNPGGLLHYPTGIYTVNDNGNYRVFIANGQSPFSLTRLDFGNSLLNIPSAIDLGNPGGVLNQPRDFTILKLCDEIAGFAVNGSSNDLGKFDFHNDLTSVPTGTSLGNTGNLNFPHSISKFFRVANDLYVLITNVNNNTITRLQFSGCTAANIASSAQQNPPTVSYNTTGTYSINLSVDEGLPTQNSFCKQVVVVPLPVHTPLQKILACNVDSVKIGTGLKQVTYLWNNGATTDSIYIKNSGSYWVQSNTPFGCSNIDSFSVTAERVTAKSNNDTSICSGKTIQLNTAGTAINYSWSPATGLSDSNIANPLATPLINTQYIVTGTGTNGCITKDTVSIQVNPSPVIAKTNDTTICHDKILQLNVTGGGTYTWLPSTTLSNINIPNPVATPVANTTYYITVTSNGNCKSSDSIKVAVKLLPVFAATPGLTICKGSPAPLIASGGDVYSWQPGAGLSNSAVYNPLATPDISTIYTVKIISSACGDSASLSSAITVLPLPVVTASSSNDVDCTKPATQLNASGALYYLWQPANGLNNPAIASPLSSPSANTVYTVKGTDLNGCFNYDSVSILVTHTGDLLVNMPNAFTPNGDGKNDCFGISRYASLLQQVQFSVYDRFGVRVFYTTNPLNCWDGRYNGTLQNAGGFVYILQANTFCGTIFKKGIVMLIK